MEAVRRAWLLLPSLLLAACGTTTPTAGDPPTGPSRDGGRCCRHPVHSPTPAPVVVTPAPTVVPPEPVPTGSPVAPPVGVLPAFDTAGRCGVERWAVKTGVDSAAASVPLTPQDTTLAALAAIPRPSGVVASSPRQAVEKVVYRVHATLVGVKRENDSDYHLVLSDGGATAVAEIPHPSCVGSSPFAAGILASRVALDDLLGAPPSTTSFQRLSVPVVVTGVGLSDFAHGQTGEGPADLELHPVLALTH